MSSGAAPMRDDSRQDYFGVILMAVGDGGGPLTREELIAIVAEDFPQVANLTWHVDRMVEAMIRDKCLVRTNGLLSLNHAPAGAQESR
jgi:hypothetical protein